MAGRALHCALLLQRQCEDRVLDGPTSAGKGSKGRNHVWHGVRASLP